PVQRLLESLPGERARDVGRDQRIHAADEITPDSLRRRHALWPSTATSPVQVEQHTAELVRGRGVNAIADVVGRDPFGFFGIFAMAEVVGRDLHRLERLAVADVVTGLKPVGLAGAVPAVMAVAAVSPMMAVMSAATTTAATSMFPKTHLLVLPF